MLSLIFISAPAKKTLQNIVNQRRLEAKHSIVVQVASQSSYNEVCQYCSEFGNIKNALFYTLPQNTKFILIEYDNVDAISKTQNSSAFPAMSTGGVRVKSRFLWLKSATNKSKSLKQNSFPELNTTYSASEPEKGKLLHILQKATSISHQMELLFKNTQLNDLSIRLRFFGALQIEEAVKGLFLDPLVLPFGSTVNGFGKLGSDLDMIFHYNSECLNSPSDYNDRRLIFHVKSFESESEAKNRETIQNHLRFLASMFTSFLPGISDVQPIYKARVPIVRYFHNYLNIDADITLMNM